PKQSNALKQTCGIPQAAGCRVGEVLEADLLNNILHEGQFATRAVEEVIGTKPEFIHRAGRQDAGVREHDLPYVRQNLAPVLVHAWLDQFLRAPAISSEPARLAALHEVDPLNKLVFVDRVT